MSLIKANKLLEFIHIIGAEYRLIITLCTLIKQTHTHEYDFGCLSAPSIDQHKPNLQSLTKVNISFEE